MKIKCLSVFVVCILLAGCGDKDVGLPVTITPATGVSTSVEANVVLESEMDSTEIDIGDYSSFYKIEDGEVTGRYDLYGTEKEESTDTEDTTDTEIVFIFEDSNDNMSVQESVDTGGHPSADIEVKNSNISNLNTITVCAETPNVSFYGEYEETTVYIVTQNEETLWDSNKLNQGESVVWHAYEELDVGEYSATITCINDEKSASKDVVLKVEK